MSTIYRQMSPVYDMYDNDDNDDDDDVYDIYVSTKYHMLTYFEMW